MRCALHVHEVGLMGQPQLCRSKCLAMKLKTYIRTGQVDCRLGSCGSPMIDCGKGWEESYSRAGRDKSHESHHPPSQKSGDMAHTTAFAKQGWLTGRRSTAAFLPRKIMERMAVGRCPSPIDARPGSLPGTRSWSSFSSTGSCDFPGELGIPFTSPA